MQERERGSARRAFAKSAQEKSSSGPSEERPAAIKGAGARKDPASVKDALDRMAASIGERRRAREDQQRRLAGSESEGDRT